MAIKKRGKSRWNKLTKKRLKRMDGLTPSERRRVERFAAVLIRLRKSNAKEAKRKKSRKRRKWPTKPGRVS